MSLLPARELVNAIARPFGDHAGVELLPVEVNRRCAAVTGEIVQMSPARTKAIRPLEPG
jgi:hypothetical protein